MGFEDFHFTRPLWLLALIPVLVILGLWLRYRSQSEWRSVIDARLLPFLLESVKLKQSNRWLHLLLLLIAWTAVVLALAGPAWQRLAQPVEIRRDALVVVLDLSLSMAVQDVSPSRLTRAKFKLTDLFERRTEGQTALIVYAGQPYTVVPFTDDTATLTHLLPSLSPDIMPVPGSRPDLALEMANQLLEDNRINRGRILFITDGIDDITRFGQAVSANHDLVVLAVGTARGAPVPDLNNPAKGFLQDAKGNLAIVQLDHNEMRSKVQSVGGLYYPLTLDRSDLEAVLPARWWLQDKQTAKTERSYDTSVEQGYWLIALALPVLLGLFRRGLLAVAFLCFLPLWSGPTALAQEAQKEQLPMKPPERNFWDRLWWSGDQQGFRALQDNELAQALDHFQSNDWRGTTHYLNGDYRKAEAWFDTDDSADGHYNRGNALAWQGRFLEALQAYTEALKLMPTMTDAQTNSELMKKLLADAQRENQSDSLKESPEKSSESQAGQQGQPQPGPSPEEENAELTDAGQEKAETGQAVADGQQGGQPAPEEEPDDEKAEEAQAGLAQSDTQSEVDEAEEARESLQQWLNRIPDDPGGLLRRKFKHEASQRARKRQRPEEPIW